MIGGRFWNSMKTPLATTVDFFAREAVSVRAHLPVTFSTLTHCQIPFKNGARKFANKRPIPVARGPVYRGA